SRSIELLAVAGSRKPPGAGSDALALVPGVAPSAWALASLAGAFASESGPASRRASPPSAAAASTSPGPLASHPSATDVSTAGTAGSPRLVLQLRRPATHPAKARASSASHPPEPRQPAALTLQVQPSSAPPGAVDPSPALTP